MKRFIILLLVLISGQAFSQDFSSLAIGEKAKDFKLNTIQGDKIQLSKLLEKQPIVLVVLRGWPGYQCPICSRQVGSLVEDADKFAESGALVLMVYPGPSEEMQKHASEFADDFEFPENFYFTIDPDYTMINKYGLRWDANKETAYPSTFVINKSGEIVYSKVSTKHGGRAENKDIIEALSKL